MTKNKNPNSTKFLPLLSSKSQTIKTDDLSIEELIKMKSDMILDPPYQRRVVWDESSKKALIKSIMCGIPVNTIHLVKTATNDGGETFTVLDGKQRLTSIFDFIENKFLIEIEINSKPMSVSWKALKAMEENSKHDNHARAKKILRDFRSYKIAVTSWSDLDLQQQSAVFGAINFGVPLTRDEKLLAEVYYSKEIASFLMGLNGASKPEGFFKPLSDRSRSKEDSRSRDFIWTLRLLHAILSDDCDNVQINTKNFTANR